MKTQNLRRTPIPYPIEKTLSLKIHFSQKKKFEPQKLTLMRTVFTPEKFPSISEQRKPVADTKDLVIHLLYHELVRAELNLHLSGVGNHHPTSMLIIRSAIATSEKYLTK